MAVTNLTIPVVSGTARRGQVLTTTPGTWDWDEVNFDLDLDYEWLRCDVDGDNCVEIAGAVNSFYTLTTADVGARIRSQVTATEVAISTPSGALYDEFSDFSPPYSNMLFLRRWSDMSLSGLGDTGTAWGDGSGIYEISTAEGDGFRWYQGSAVPRGSGGGVQIASHFKGGSFGEYDITGKLMLPSGNNPTFPSYGDWNVIWEWVDGSHTIRNALGVDALAPGGPTFYVTTYKPGFGYHSNNLKVRADDPLVKGQWYDFRWHLNLSKSGDGFARFWLDGDQIMDHSGATLSSDYNAKIWTQFGWYGGTAAASNEVQIVDLRVA